MKRTQPMHRSSLRQHAVLALNRQARMVQEKDKHPDGFFAAHGLNAAQFDVLAHVGAARGTSQQELADALLVTKGNVSQLLNKLEQDGLITRRQEGRTNCLSLTDRGKAIYEIVVPQQEALIADLLSPLSADEQHELLRLLRKLDHSIPS